MRFDVEVLRSIGRIDSKGKCAIELDECRSHHITIMIIIVLFESHQTNDLINNCVQKDRIE